MTQTPSHLEQIFRDVWQKHRASIIFQSGGKTTEAWDEKELPQLVQLLNRHFNEEELKTFTFELGEQYDNLPAQSKDAKARELVTKFFRLGRLADLINHAKEARPNVSWDTKAYRIAKQWEQVDWTAAARNYSEFIKNTYGTMRVLGQPAPVPLEGIFTDVYILDKRLATQRFSIEEMQKLYARYERVEHRAKQQPGLEAVRTIQKLFILGKPGAGKTTFLKYLALQAVDEELPLLPLFVPLKQWADADTPLLQFLGQQLEVCYFPSSAEFVEKLLQEGKSLLLLDGLDEVGETHRGRVTEAIRKAAEEYGKNQFVMTCRIAANEYTFTQFTEGEMADFAPPQVERFAQKWFAADMEKGNLFLTELKKPEHEGLRELARIPLLLTLLCLGFAETLVFPNRRAEIYEEAIDALLKKWDASRNIRRDEPYKNLTLRHKRQLLARIAAASFKKGIYFFPKSQLVEVIKRYLRGVPGSNPDEIDGEAVLQAMEAQHGILIERAHGIYSFAHLAFQEYFTARYIVDNAADGTLRWLCMFLTERRWREVFLLTASFSGNASLLFAGMLKRLNGIATANTALGKLLIWADKKAKGKNLTNSRTLYLFLALDLTLALDIDLALNVNVARAFASTLSRSLDHIFDLALDSNLAHILDLDVVFILPLTLNLALTRLRFLDINHPFAFDLDAGLEPDAEDARARARSQADTLDRIVTSSLNHDIVLDFVLGYVLLIAEAYYVGELFQKVIMWNEKSILNQAFKKLKIPDEKASEKMWQQFCADLRHILQTHRQLAQAWQFTEEDVKVLEEYLAGCELVVQCLKLAYVADREAILARLLQPPEMGKEF